MLDAIGVGSVDDLFAEIPSGLRLAGELDLPPGLSETECFDHLASLAERNAHAESELCFLGAGMYDHYVPEIGRASCRERVWIAAHAVSWYATSRIK